jgi:acetyltransferase EpsM
MPTAGERRRVIVLGGPGGGEVTAQLVLDLSAAGAPFELLGYLNDELPRSHRLHAAPVLGHFDAWKEQPDDVVFAASLHHVKHMPARAARLSGLGIPETRWATLVHPRAAVADGVRIGAGSTVAAFASVGPGARLGPHVALRPGAQVGHGVELAGFAFVGANAALCGYVRIDEGAHLAPGALVREHLRVGAWAVVGLGAVVLRDVPERAVVAGNPARLLRRPDDDA